MKSSCSRQPSTRWSVWYSRRFPPSAPIRDPVERSPHHSMDTTLNPQAPQNQSGVITPKSQRPECGRLLQLSRVAYPVYSAKGWHRTQLDSMYNVGSVKIFYHQRGALTRNPWVGVDSTDEVWKLVFTAVYYKQYLTTFVDIYTVIPRLVFKDVLQSTELQKFCSPRKFDETEFEVKYILHVVSSLIFFHFLSFLHSSHSMSNFARFIKFLSLCGSTCIRMSITCITCVCCFKFNLNMLHVSYFCVICSLTYLTI